MSFEQNLPSVVPAFESIESLQRGLEAKDNFEPFDLYPRDGTMDLAKQEARVAELVGVKADQLVLCSSGMAAVVGAVESCLAEDTVLAYPEQSYSQTGRYVHNLQNRGVKAVLFDSGSVDSISRIVDKYQPTVILSETVGNGPDVPVLDVPALLDMTEYYDPYIVLDHTLPLSTGLSVDTFLDENRRVIGVESGTKSYVFNAEICGQIYTKHPGILRTIREQRRTSGYLPNVAATRAIDILLPESKTDFDERNRRVFEVTTALAKACLEAEGAFAVSHPELTNHPNHTLAEARYPAGSTPVFYLQPFDGDQFGLAQRLWAAPEVRAVCELGQSFAFDKTRILPDAHYPAVRIAGGAKTDVDALTSAFKAALSQ